MKRIFGLMIVLTIAIGFSMPAHATLLLRGTDTLGNRLIYDEDLNITWYDYSNWWDSWQNQVNWASGLSVTFGDTTYTDWRLPSTVDGPYVFGYDGTTTAGYNITSSEMGHLFYIELGNIGYCDTNGTCPQVGWGLSNTGDFQNLKANYYWSGTEEAASPDYAWYLNFSTGVQDAYDKGYSLLAIAVRDGDVSSSATIPEPASLLLLGSGLLGLAGIRRVKKRKAVSE